MSNSVKIGPEHVGKLAVITVNGIEFIDVEEVPTGASTWPKEKRAPHFADRVNPVHCQPGRHIPRKPDMDGQS